MEKKQLTKQFFEDHPLRDFSAAQMTFFRMQMLEVEGMDEQVFKMTDQFINQSRRDKYMAEREYIGNLTEAKDIVSHMRKLEDPINGDFLIRKALEYQDDVIPLIWKRICTSAHDLFIENVALLLALADEKYTDQLYDIFPDIRNAYARSELCLVFGVKKKKEYTELLLEQFRKIKEEKPDKSYVEGPLMALYAIYEPFKNA